MNTPTHSKHLKATSTENEAGQRLDIFIAGLDEISSRSRAQSLIREGRVLVNDLKQKASYLIASGDKVDIFLPQSKATEAIPENIPLKIVYEDNDLAVVMKPSGMVVHPAHGHDSGTLVNALIYHLSDLSMGFEEQRPGIVHRLDKETSGLLVVAKNDHSHEGLARQFKEKSVSRKYWALCFGKTRDHFSIESNLVRHPKNRKRFTGRSETNTGKWARTHVKTLRHLSDVSLVECQLETGRTHQIRVHLSEHSHPILGDVLYGATKRLKNLQSGKLKRALKDLDRIMLHAYLLGFVHPRTNEFLEFKEPWPQDAHQILELSGVDYDSL